MGGGRNEDKVGKGGEGFVNNRQIWVNMRREILFVFAVTPCVGVWIEIASTTGLPSSMRSLPVWECGLKYGGIIQTSR